MRRRRTHCVDCGIELIDGITTLWSSPQKRRSRCKECHNTNNRNVYQDQRIRTPESIREFHLKGKYGITLEEYNKMMELHQGGCAICRQPCKTGRNLAVDHNHRTGEIRGLLCARCNAVLGQLDDNEDLIWKIMEYLKRTTWKDEVA